MTLNKKKKLPGGYYIMHIPDGLMDPTVAAVGWIIALIVIAISTKVINKKIDEKQLPLMAILAGGIFVAQMLNFPIGGGTTGHLIGSVLAAVLLGPYAAMLVIVVILIIQALLFGDGGITAFGLNVVNMAVIGCFLGWYIYRLFPKKLNLPGIFFASWTTVFIGAFACSVELAVSHAISGGIYGISGFIAYPTMLSLHSIIGIGEAIITSGVIIFITRISPEIIDMPKIMMRGVLREVKLHV